MTGFRLVDWEKRWSTDNKVVRVVDPRGYELEIYIPNLMYLILNCNINKGLINEELVWLRDGAINRLYPSNSDEYRNAKAMFDKTKLSGGKIKEPRQEVGEVVRDSWGNELIYLGMKTVQWLGIAGTVDKYSPQTGHWRHIMHEYIDTTEEVLYSETKRFHCYFPLSQCKNRKEITTYAKQIKVDAILGQATEAQLAELTDTGSTNPVRIDRTNYFNPQTGEFKLLTDEFDWYTAQDNNFIETNIARITNDMKFDEFDVQFEDLAAVAKEGNSRQRWFKVEEIIGS
jgi:hypothetical protein